MQNNFVSAAADTSYSSNKLIVVDACNLSGSREANVVVDIGMDTSYATREYYGYTNNYGQLSYVHADEIIIQKDDEEASSLRGDGRYCSDEAKVPGVESSSLDEGHAVADSLGGVSNAYNITPQESKLNRSGEQADMEERIRNASASGSSVTNFNYYIEYENSTTQIPLSYTVSYEVNGVLYEDSYNNTYTKASDPVSSTTENESSTPNVGGEVYYENCTAAKSAGAAPVMVGDPGYGSHLDRDGDGVGCSS